MNNWERLASAMQKAVVERRIRCGNEDASQLQFVLSRATWKEWWPDIREALENKLRPDPVNALPPEAPEDTMGLQFRGFDVRIGDAPDGTVVLERKDQFVDVVKIVLNAGLAQRLSREALQQKIAEAARRSILKTYADLAGVFRIDVAEFRAKPPHAPVGQWAMRDGQLERLS